MGRKEEKNFTTCRELYKARTKKQIAKSLAETAKYTVKNNDFL